MLLPIIFINHAIHYIVNFMNSSTSVEAKIVKSQFKMRVHSFRVALISNCGWHWRFLLPLGCFEKQHYTILKVKHFLFQFGLLVTILTRSCITFFQTLHVLVTPQLFTSYLTHDLISSYNKLLLHLNFVFYPM